MQAIGVPLTGFTSRSTRASANLQVYEVAWLLGLGAVAVLGQMATRDHSHLPGHQGLFWIGMLMVGRTTASARWAGTTTAASAAGVSMLPMVGFNDPFRWLAYLAVGAAVDLAFLGLGRWTDRLWLITVVGGFAYLAKPLLRLGINLTTGIPIGTVRWGVAYPLFTHFLFGAAGAAVGAGIVLGARRVIRTDQPQ